jgi:hypothetical protein
MSLAQYLKRFSRLRTSKDRKPWSFLTTYQALSQTFSTFKIGDIQLYPGWVESDPGYLEK